MPVPVILWSPGNIAYEMSSWNRKKEAASLDSEAVWNNERVTLILQKKKKKSTYDCNSPHVQQTMK